MKQNSAALAIFVLLFACGTPSRLPGQTLHTTLTGPATDASNPQETTPSAPPSLPLATWSLDAFDRFTRIEIGSTPKPWLNIIGNGLFGGHLIFLLSNRHDGREFRIDTRKTAITNTTLHLEVGSGGVRRTTHGIGYSTLVFGDDPERLPRVTYFIEPDTHDSEIWLIDNSAGSKLALRYGDKSLAFHSSLAFRVTDNRVEEISLRSATEKLAGTKRQWLQYLARALDRMGVRHVASPLLLREFIWDIYQIAVMVHTDHFPVPEAGALSLRAANMGGTYTFLGLDVHGRDTLQMIPAISRFDPPLAREILLNMARYIDKKGRVCHRRLLSGQPIDRGHSDESYWFVIVLSEYLRNTRDLSVLEERAPYLDNELASEYVLFKDPDWVRRLDAKGIDPARFTGAETSVLEHVRRAVRDVRFGRHGLPLMEDGDWNDALNWMPTGESVMNAGLYAYSLMTMRELWQGLGKRKVDALLGSGSFERDLLNFAEEYRRIKQAVNEHAWDGQWYIRGFDNRGAAFGSHANTEGKIYLNAQSWLILAGIPDDERAQKMVHSVSRYLLKDNKVSLLSPAYKKRDNNIGAITLLPPGSNENGGQWRQCTLWWIGAMRKLGRQEEAVRLFEELLLVNADLRKMGTEPYLYNEYVRGPEATDPGSGGQQAHVQQAALVLDRLGELYPQVRIRGRFVKSYDYPGGKSEDTLYSITGSGEVVPWVPKWVENPHEYELILPSTR